jgi:ornithine racemase
MGVSKATLGNPSIANAMIQGGVQFIADSRLENIQRMKAAGVLAQFVLLRTAPSQAEAVVESVDISLNTEIETIQQLSHYASIANKSHKIILMVELGDLREGILTADLAQFIQIILKLPNIKIIGIGCNLACYGGIKPNQQKMNELSDLAETIEQKFQIKLDVVSGGNSANYEWSQTSDCMGRVNNLRLGESILLGRESVKRSVIPGLYAQAFQLVAEVIESKMKPSVPFGDVCQDAFGHVPTFLDRGIRRRVIVGLGRQDVLLSGLTSSPDLEILGASSDHIVLDVRDNSSSNHFNVGSEVRFNLDYGGLLSAMTSPFVQKHFVGWSDAYGPIVTKRTYSQAKHRSV